LNWFDMYNSEKDKKIKPLDEPIEITGESDDEKEKENEAMKKTMRIEGMMCGHCEARVKKTLEAIAEVESAEVSHKNGTAIVSLKVAIADEVLKNAVEAQDYTVIAIE